MPNAVIFYATTLLCTASSVLAQLPGPNWRWCNSGTAGTNFCEERGWHTYCCSGSPASEGEFQYPKEVLAEATNPQGTRDCVEDPNFKGTYLGQVYCA
ncbi:hypothetical protein Slin14017_G020200 [Septoria linicola]|nr:hypothetical protein Slin14017_G020200 [Septoria linicola]